MQLIQQRWIDRMGLVVTKVTQEVIHAVKRFRQIDIASSINQRELLAGMRVLQGERAGR